MIVSFKSKKLKKFFLEDKPGGLPAEQVKKIKRILFRLNNAYQLADLREHPNFNLHPLAGDFKGFYAMSVTGNYRVIFRFEEGKVSEVDYLDYH